MENQPFFIGLGASIFGGVLFWLGFKKYHKYRLIKDTPTSKIRSLAMGIVEIHGKAGCDEQKYIKTPFSQTNCFLYTYRIEEYRKHTTTDSKGRARTTYRWETIARGRDEIDFTLTDDTGSVIINPKKSDVKIDVRKAYLQKAGFLGAFSGILSSLKMLTSDSSYKGFDPKKLNLMPIDTKSIVSFGSRVGDRRYYEHFITDNDEMYILGTAANNASTTNKVKIIKGENEPTYIISDKSEKELLKKMGWGVAGLLLGGTGLILLGLWLILSAFGVS